MIDVARASPCVRALEWHSFDAPSVRFMRCAVQTDVGKSTLIGYPSGVYQPDGGSMRIEGARADCLREPPAAPRAGTAASSIRN